MDIQCLHVTTGDQLWAYDSVNGVIAINHTPLEFIRLTDPNKTYRLVGSARNAELISNLYKNTKSTVQVVTPLVAKTQRERMDVHKLLPLSYNCCLPSHLGGPHELQHTELINYDMAHAVAANAPVLPLHPFLDNLKWIRGLNKQAVSKLFGIIIDPRWYVDPNNPNRLSKLYAYLKLDPKHMQLTTISRLSHPRCETALACWYSPGLATIARRNYLQFGSTVDADSNVFGLGPEEWLWRMWWYLTDFGNYSIMDTTAPPAKDVYAKALLKVTKRLVRFIYHIWMETVYPNNIEWQFRPQDFLRYTSEIECYNQTVGSY